MQIGRLRHLQEEVRAVAQLVSAIGGLGNKAPGLNREEMLIPHEFSHAPHIAGLSDLDQVLHDPSGSATAFVLQEDVPYQRSKLRILDFSRGGIPRLPRVVRRTTDLKDFAHRDDRLLLLQRDRLDGRVDVGHSLRPKMTNASRYSEPSNTVENVAFASHS